MQDEIVNVAEAKKRFSEILGKVAYGRKKILITKKGKPMARLVPSAEENDLHLGYAKGWLDKDDPFFDDMRRMMQERSQHIPRILKKDSVTRCIS